MRALATHRHLAGERYSIDELATLAGVTPRTVRYYIAQGEAEALGLAIGYQLLGKQTHCILVHQRAEADKATGEAELHRVGSMLAAGWGATGAVMAPMAASFALTDMAMASEVTRGGGSDDRLLIAGVDGSYGGTLFLRKVDRVPAPVSLEAIAQAVVEHLSRGGEVEALAAHCESLSLHVEVSLALEEAVNLGASEGQALLLLAWRTNSRSQGIGSASIAAALQPHIDALATSLVTQCVELFKRLLGGYPIDGWGLSRARRLRRALSRAVSADDAGI